MRALAIVLVVAACGDDAAQLPPAPAELAAGPVRISTSDAALTVGPLAITGFVAVGTVATVDEAHYYDPRGDDAVTFAPATHALGQDGDWTLFDNGVRARLAACPIADCAILDVDAAGVANAVMLRVSLPRPADEPLYGTGDAARRANVAGTIREMQLRLDDRSESSLNETHVPVPLVLWPRSGVGMLVADDRPGALDLASSSADRVHATFDLPVRGAFRVYLYTRPHAPLDLVRAYTALTAQPAVPPKWAFAPQQWRNVWNSSDEVRGDADAMRSRHIPGSVMWIDNPWQTGYNTLTFDEGRFVDPPQLFADLTARGYKVVMWSTPYVGTSAATAADHAEGAAQRYFVEQDGHVLDVPWANGPGALVDFTRDGATAWWQERIRRVIDLAPGLGAAGFKLDFAEEIVPDIGGTILPMQLAAGDNAVMHNRYAAGYHAAYLGALPPGDGFLITRAGAWGEQGTNTCIWPGDLDSDFREHGDDADGNGKRNIGGLPSAISRGLSLSVSGYPFYGSDIGGFKGFPTTESLLRWAEYAAYGTIMQLGGGGKSHDPWDGTLFEAGADAIYKRYAVEHMRLVPYLWTLALQAGRDGTPVTRPARFVADCACDDAMFFLGDDLLIAPVVTPGATTRTIVLPPGEWIAADGSTQSGTITVPAPLDTIPVFQRAGSIVPRYAKDADTLLPATAAGVTSYATTGLGDELRLTWAGDDATARVHDGTTATATGGTVTLVGGDAYRALTIDTRRSATTVLVDGAPIPQVPDVFACASPGCWSTASGRLEIRVPIAPGATHAVTLQ